MHFWMSKTGSEVGKLSISKVYFILRCEFVEDLDV